MTESTTSIDNVRERIKIYRMIILSMGITDGIIVDFLAIANVHREPQSYLRLARKNKSL